MFSAVNAVLALSKCINARFGTSAISKLCWFNFSNVQTFDLSTCQRGPSLGRRNMPLETPILPTKAILNSFRDSGRCCGDLCQVRDSVVVAVATFARTHGTGCLTIISLDKPRASKPYDRIEPHRGGAVHTSRPGRTGASPSPMQSSHERLPSRNFDSQS